MKIAVVDSASQAARYGSRCVVQSGIDGADYPAPDLDAPRRRGGGRLNFRMGVRLTLSPRVRFHGWVGGEKKWGLLRGSRGLAFPVRRQEPFGLAVVESRWFGCPVSGTPCGPATASPGEGRAGPRPGRW